MNLLVSKRAVRCLFLIPISSKRVCNWWVYTQCMSWEQLTNQLALAPLLSSPPLFFLPSPPLFHPWQVKLQLSEEELREEVCLLQQQRPHPIASHYCNPRRSSLEPNIFFEPTLSLLLQWCRAVCAIYGVPVSICCSIYLVRGCVYDGARNSSLALSVD